VLERERRQRQNSAVYLERNRIAGWMPGFDPLPRYPGVVHSRSTKMGIYRPRASVLKGLWKATW
jgi:hypothetical protein